MPKIDLDQIEKLIVEAKKEFYGCTNVNGFEATIELGERCEQLVKELRAATEVVEAADCLAICGSASCECGVCVTYKKYREIVGE